MGTACIPQPWPLCTHRAIKPWPQMSWGGGREVSFLLAGLLALLPWADKSLSNVRLVHTQQDNFLNGFSDWRQSGTSIPSQYCSQQLTPWWWPVKHQKHSLLPSCWKWKEHRDRTGMVRRKIAGISASPMGSARPWRPLHHSISSLYQDHRSPGAPPAPSSCPIPPSGWQFSPPISPTLPALSTRTLWYHSFPSQFNSTLLKYGTF